ncbi:hypothetical protein Tco_0892095 [Tanacetum coccineum]|uniref:Uncharacterized protein n=1 Tax=Tanacetum coccineum TaxID=301880 RepID=A0ABQ5C809_9ASTR
MVHQLTKFHVQRVDMVINPPWNLPFLGAKGLTSPEQTATVEMVFSRPWTCTFLVAKGLATPELMANEEIEVVQPVLLTHDTNYDGEEEEFEDTNGDIDLDSSNHSSDDDA